MERACITLQLKLDTYKLRNLGRPYKKNQMIIFHLRNYNLHRLLRYIEIATVCLHKHLETSLLLRRFVFHMAEESAKRVTGDHNKPQGTMGRVQTAGEAPARSCVVFLAKSRFLGTAQFLVFLSLESDQF